MNGGPLRGIRSNTLSWTLLLLLLIFILSNVINIEWYFGFNFSNMTVPYSSACLTNISINSTFPVTTTPAYTRNIYLQFRGRFGNVIFEIVGVYGMLLAANYQKMYFVDYWMETNHQAGRFMKVFPKFHCLVHIVPRLPPNLIVVKELSHNKYHRKTLDELIAATQDVHLKTYLGVADYWRPRYEKEIKELLEVSEDYQRRARSYLFQLASNQNVSLDLRKDTLKSGISPKLPEKVPVLVGIHSRRGDKSTWYKLEGWVMPEKSYFQNAMDYYRSKFKRVYFIVASQDKKWGKENIVGKDVIHSTSPDDLLEFVLLTLCDHFIISVGTFGWWAGYLTGGEVVYFPDHVKPNSYAGKRFNNTQYFLPQWKPIL